MFKNYDQKLKILGVIETSHINQLCLSYVIFWLNCIILGHDRYRVDVYLLDIVCILVVQKRKY